MQEPIKRALLLVKKTMPNGQVRCYVRFARHFAAKAKAQEGTLASAVGHTLYLHDAATNKRPRKTIRKDAPEAAQSKFLPASRLFPTGTIYKRRPLDGDAPHALILQIVAKDFVEGWLGTDRSRVWLHAVPVGSDVYALVEATEQKGGADA